MCRYRRAQCTPRGDGEGVLVQGRSGHVGRLAWGILVGARLRRAPALFSDCSGFAVADFVADFFAGLNGRAGADNFAVGVAYN